MSEKLDLDRNVVLEKKPTPYLEDIISQIVDDIGGENAQSVPDQIELSQVLGFANLARIKANR